jgi:hypothetical protein
MEIPPHMRLTLRVRRCFVSKHNRSCAAGGATVCRSQFVSEVLTKLP